MSETDTAPRHRRPAWRQPARPVTIVMYHAIERRHRPNTHVVGAEAFARQIATIRRHYRVIPLSRIDEALAGPAGVRSVVITFDDGFRDFVDFAHPVLACFDVPATVFVPTGFIGLSDVVGEEEIHRLDREGLIEFGSHTVSHANMRDLDEAAMRREAADSKHALQSLLGHTVTTFAYPFGQRHHLSALARRVLAECGYRVAVTTCWGTWNSIDDLLALKRIVLDEADDGPTIRAKIEGRLSWPAVTERLSSVWRVPGAMCRTAARRWRGWPTRPPHASQSSAGR